jgi:ribosomal protein S18 acetylase RimI-like enzyme
MSDARSPHAAISVEQVGAVSDDLVAALERLIGQLSSSSAPPGAAEVEQIVASPATTLLIARDEDRAVVGTLTLALFRIPTGLRAWIEDVVVDEDARGQGVGGALTREAVRIAQDAGARTVDLTSRPSRGPANRLYTRLGFRQRATNVYRATAGPEE